jgi:hypothetical protein
MKRFLPFFLALLVWAGQSFVFNFSTQTLSNPSAPAQNGALMVEYYFDVTPTTLVSNPIFLSSAGSYPSTGISIELSNGCIGGLCLNASLPNETQTLGNTVIGTGAGYPTSALVMRVQRDVAALGAGHGANDRFEIWGSDAINHYQVTAPYSSYGTTSNGAGVNANADGFRLAFMRECSGAVLPLGSKMPTTAGGCPVGTLVFEWKFEGNLNDSSTNGYNAALSGGGSTSYASSLYQVPYSITQSSPAPFWSNTVSMRAGHPNPLTCAASLSQADSSNAGTCYWQITASPLINGSPFVPTFSSYMSTTGSPGVTLSPFVFGDHAIQQTFVDANGASSVSSVHIGAVATDSNFVAIHASPIADQIFGPHIMWGKNPWGAQDYLQSQAVTLRSAVYQAGDPGIPPSWDVAQPGTVSYPFQPPNGTTVATGHAVGATDQTITVTDATQLDLLSFPTIITLGYFNGNGYNTGQEAVVISGSAGNVLTVAYDGRGFRCGTQNHSCAAAWPAGANVQQFKVTGSGTNFLTNINPLGAGWSGPALPGFTGTCAVTAGSAAVVGTTTNWSSSPSNSQYLPGYGIQIQGTSATSVAFSFYAYVSSVADATHLTLNRVFPADATAPFSGLTCTPFRPDWTSIVLHYGRCGSGAYPGCLAYAFPLDGQTYFQTDGCLSNTACYLYNTHDPNSVHPTYSTCLTSPPYPNTQMQCGVHWSYMAGFGYVGDNGGTNFYDEGLAWYDHYLRSGLASSLAAFRMVEGQEGTSNHGYMWYPELAQNDIGTQSRRASVLGMWVAYLLDGKTSNLSGLRNFANSTATTYIGPNCNTDLREGIAYPLHWLAAAAVWDPSSVSLGYPTTLQTWYNNYAPCQVTSGSALVQHSWANNFLWNTNQTPALTATNGSAVITGTGIPSDICGAAPAGTGTATVTQNSDVVTGSGFVTGGGKILFEDPGMGTLTFRYIYDSSVQIHLSGQYPGSTASGVVWWIDTDATNNGSGFDSTLVFAVSGADPQLSKQWVCTASGSSQITLDRAWDGPSTSVLYGWRGAKGGVGVAGNGTEVFYVGGVLNRGLYTASLIGGALGASFTTLQNNATNWVKTYGIDPLTGGTYYGRIYPGSEPPYADSSQPLNFSYRNPQASWPVSSGSPNYNIQYSRSQLGEISTTFWSNYNSNQTGANQTFWDGVYKNIWDLTPYTAAGFTGDAIGSLNCNLQTNFAGGKWPGFCFGIGQSSQYPAGRLGGQLAAINRSDGVGFYLPGVPNATSVSMIVTAPTGIPTTTNCSSSPCVLPADARQGDHTLVIQYKSAGGAVLAQSDPQVLAIR